MIISNIWVDESFVDDLIKEQGIVNSRVALLLRSVEIKPSFRRFVLEFLYSLQKRYIKKTRTYHLPPS